MQQRRHAQLFFLLVTVLGCPLQSAAGPSVGYFHSIDASDCEESKSVNVIIRPDNTTLTLLLKESSRDFIAPDALADGQFFDLRYRPCYYQGGNPDNPDDNSAVAKQIQGRFSATFGHNGATYEVPSQPADSPEFEAQLLPPTPFRFSCGLNVTQGNEQWPTARQTPALHRCRGRLDLNSPMDESQQTYVLLVLVGDQAFVSGTGGDFIKATERLWEIGNYINNLYKPLGVNVVTVRAQTLFSDTLGLGNNATGSKPETMLTSFMNYRMQFLTDVVHTAAHLVSGLRMTGANVGLANYGKLCQFALAGGVNSRFQRGRPVAHELGHNLGMNHDPDTPFSCGCSDSQGCIMTAVGTDVNPIHFSNCSIQEYKQFSVANGLGYCMTRPPTKATLGGIAPKCGNRVLDFGEECDCGTPRFCNNTCCDPTTCKLTPGATCASGQCCNTTTCSMESSGSVCRASRGACDLPEYCNGTSEWCPEIDDYKMDGTSCATDPANASRVLAYCYQGNCVTRDARCKALFTAPDFRAAPESYSVKTKDDSGFGEGYCSYRIETYSPVKYTFVPCTTQNQRCGTLYCIGTMPDGFPTAKWKGFALNDAKSIVPINPSDHTLAYARLDLTISGYRDPGMVPDGAECGPGLMCINSECLNVTKVMTNATTLAEVSSLPNCNGQGDVTRTGLCFCYYGFSPPDCVAVGYGGSITNLPAESGAITTSTMTTPKPTTPTTRLEFTTLEQSRDDFWLYIGIGIGIAIVLVLAIVFFVWLYFWCRRNDFTPYIGGCDVPVPDASAAAKFRSSADMRSYPLDETASPEQVAVSTAGFNHSGNGSGGGGKSYIERQYAANSYFNDDFDNPGYHSDELRSGPQAVGSAQKYEIELEVGVPGKFVKKC
uniref:Peptidase M12B domain-containing protein n=2 Tax=Macrostomum lignano TaxID=282301 RepID=A0A1I8FUI3_9PLAT